MLKLTVVSDDGVVVEIRGEGEFSQVRTEINVNPFEQLLGAEAFRRKVMVNLEAVDYLDSSGIGWLVVCHKNFRQHGGRLVLYNLPPRILQILQFCRMELLLHLAADPAAARKLAEGEPS